MTGEDDPDSPGAPTGEPADDATGAVDGSTVDPTEEPATQGDSADPLAAIVPKASGDAVLAALRETGEYDDGRRIREQDDGTLAIPIEGPLAAERQARLGIVEVVRQRDPDPRPTDLGAVLAERGWSGEEIDRAPASWAVVGSVVLVDVPADCPDEAALGAALLDLHREADTVLAREGIDGPTRDPERRVIAGIGDTETVHTEHGVRYGLDLATVMFSPGNQAERARMAALVAAGRERDRPVATIAEAGDRPGPGDRTAGPVASATAPASVDPIPDDVPALDPLAGASGPDAVDPAVDAVGEPGAEGDDLSAVGGPSEHVFDMFAGAGYFSLPAAIAGARVTATEIDAGTFGYLIENAQLNGVGERVSAYLADCRDVADAVTADRVVMGHYDAHEYLDAAFAALGDDGVLHYHAVVPEAELWDRPRERLERAAEEAGRSIAVADERRIKSYGEGVWHVVVDAVVTA